MGYLKLPGRAFFVVGFQGNYVIPRVYPALRPRIILELNALPGVQFLNEQYRDRTNARVDETIVESVNNKSSCVIGELLAKIYVS